MSNSDDKQRDSWLGNTFAAENIDLLKEIGGVRGILEAIIPTALFLILYVTTENTALSVGVACAAALLAILARAVTKLPVKPAIGGALGLVVSAVIALATGRAENVFLVGILINAVYLGGFLGALIRRYPVVGLAVAFAQGFSMRWRNDPQLARVRRAFYVSTWIWIALFAIRLIVELPLYLLGATEALAVAKMILGIPLFALAVWFTWLIVHSVNGELAQFERENPQASSESESSND